MSIFQRHLKLVAFVIFCSFIIFISPFCVKFLLFQIFFPQPEWFNISKFFTPLQNYLLRHLSWGLETDKTRKGLYTPSQQHGSFKYLWNDLEYPHENLRVIPCLLIFKFSAIYQRLYWSKFKVHFISRVIIMMIIMILRLNKISYQIRVTIRLRYLPVAHRALFTYMTCGAVLYTTATSNSSFQLPDAYL